MVQPLHVQTPKMYSYLHNTFHDPVRDKWCNVHIVLLGFWGFQVFHQTIGNSVYSRNVAENISRFDLLVVSRAMLFPLLPSPAVKVIMTLGNMPHSNINIFSLRTEREMELGDVSSCTATPGSPPSFWSLKGTGLHFDTPPLQPQVHV